MSPDRAEQSPNIELIQSRHHETGDARDRRMAAVTRLGRREPRAPTHRAGQAHRPHQAFDGAARLAIPFARHHRGYLLGRSSAAWANHVRLEKSRWSASSFRAPPAARAHSWSAMGVSRIAPFMVRDYGNSPSARCAWRTTSRSVSTVVSSSVVTPAATSTPMDASGAAPPLVS